jgi:uncharacterized protein YfaS (alpha-2-macroglobulin family)
MNQRRSAGWGTTNETSFAIIALTDHLLATSFNEVAASASYTVRLNGETIASGTLGRGEPSVSLVIPRAQLRQGVNALTITQSGGRQLYYVVNSRVYVAQREIAAAGDVRITRQYLDAATRQPLTSLTAGQLVQVRLTVTMPDRGNYMIIEDKLPGGAE